VAVAWQPARTVGWSGALHERLRDPSDHREWLVLELTPRDADNAIARGEEALIASAVSLEGEPAE
jgi:hypothetical protein